MEGSAKEETVIIVHGTWAAPKPGKRLWYQPVTSVAAAQPLFTAKLDAALQERGSPARCWAHCSQGDQTFQWSGANSWIARTRAASALGDYVAKLQKEGWGCHIVAHSHGGNIVVEALPQIMSVSPGDNRSPGKIVTLGTPFMDAISPILKRANRRVWFVKTLALIALTLFMLLMFLLSIWNAGHIWLIVFCIVFPLPYLGLLLQHLNARKSSSFWEGFVQEQPQLLAIGSLKDEAWQILHHMRDVGNPLAIHNNVFVYLFSSLRSSILQRREISLIQGAKSWQNLRMGQRIVAGLLHILFHVSLLAFGFWMFLLITLLWEWDMGYINRISVDAEVSRISITMFSSSLDSSSLTAPIWTIAIVPVYFMVLVLTNFLGDSFHSAFLSPYRRYARLVGALLGIPNAVATYIVRRRGWSVLLAVTMGLEGYRYRVPIIEQSPSYAPQNSVKYEDMPVGAEQRALAGRNAWIASHLDDVV